jgi:hypothetical protein
MEMYGSSSIVRIDYLFSNELSSSFIYRKLIGQMPLRLSSPKYSQLPNANLPALILKITERRSSSPKCTAVYVESKYKIRLCSRAGVTTENRWTLNIPSFNRVVELWSVTEVSEETGRGLNAGSILKSAAGRVCVMLVLLMTAGFAGRLQKGPPQSISPEFS